MKHEKIYTNTPSPSRGAVTCGEGLSLVPDSSTPSHALVPQNNRRKDPVAPRISFVYSCAATGARAVGESLQTCCQQVSDVTKALIYGIITSVCVAPTEKF